MGSEMCIRDSGFPHYPASPFLQERGSSSRPRQTRPGISPPVDSLCRGNHSSCRQSSHCGHDHTRLFLSFTPWRIHCYGIGQHPLPPCRYSPCHRWPVTRPLFGHRSRSRSSNICVFDFHHAEELCPRRSHCSGPLWRPFSLPCSRSRPSSPPFTRTRRCPRHPAGRVLPQQSLVSCISG